MALAKTTIGSVLAPGCRAADLIGTQAVLGIDPLRHATHWLAESDAPVRAAPNMRFVPNLRFDDCPKLDVLVVPELDEASLADAVLLAFLARVAAEATQVIAVSNGVLALAKAGLLEGRKVTADRKTLPRLRELGVEAVETSGVVRDGRWFTAGPSTGAIEAAYTLLQERRGNFLAKLAELNLEYAPQARFDDPALVATAPPADSRPLEVVTLAASGMYLPDVSGALDVLGVLPEANIRVAWKKTKPIRCALGPTIVPDTRFDDCPQADVLVLGFNLPKLSADPEVLEFLRRQSASARVVICVCAGSLLMGAAGLLEGERATSNFHMTSLLGSCGVEASREHLVRSGKYYSAGPAIGSYETALLALEELHGPEVAAYVEREVLEYSPNPPFGVGSPEQAGPWLTLLSRALSAPLLPAYWWTARKGFRAQPGPGASAGVRA